MALDRLSMTYIQRAELAQNQVAHDLFHLMEKKQTNLALAADVFDVEDLLAVMDEVGPEVAVVKTHVDLLEYPRIQAEINGKTRFVYDVDSPREEVVALSKKHDFLIFEDRKYVDIGGVAKRQFTSGIFKIAGWSDMTNAFTIAGPGTVKALDVGVKEYFEYSEQSPARGLILLPYMTPEGNLTSREFAQATMDIGAQFPEHVMGWIGAGKPAGKLEHEVEYSSPGTIIMTPGCKLPDDGTKATENLKHGQVYTDPNNLISRGSDVIIVGSGIYGMDDRAAAAQVYREAGWKAYLERTGRGDE